MPKEMTSVSTHGIMKHSVDGYHRWQPPHVAVVEGGKRACEVREMDDPDPLVDVFWVTHEKGGDGIVPRLVRPRVRELY